MGGCTACTVQSVQHTWSIVDVVNTNAQLALERGSAWEGVCRALSPWVCVSVMVGLPVRCIAYNHEKLLRTPTVMPPSPPPLLNRIVHHSNSRIVHNDFILQQLINGSLAVQVSHLLLLQCHQDTFLNLHQSKNQKQAGGEDTYVCYNPNTQTPRLCI